jgi:hypothetical protein
VEAVVTRATVTGLAVGDVHQPGGRDVVHPHRHVGRQPGQPQPAEDGPAQRRERRRRVHDAAPVAPSWKASSRFFLMDGIITTTTISTAATSRPADSGRVRKVVQSPARQQQRAAQVLLHHRARG